MILYRQPRPHAGIHRHSLIEAVEESLDLVLDGVLDAVRNNQSDIFRLVLLGDGNLTAPLFQLDDLLLAKLVIFNGELLLLLLVITKRHGWEA